MSVYLRTFRVVPLAFDRYMADFRAQRKALLDPPQQTIGYKSEAQSFPDD